MNRIELAREYGRQLAKAEFEKRAFGQLSPEQRQALSAEAHRDKYPILRGMGRGMGYGALGGAGVGLLGALATKNPMAIAGGASAGVGLGALGGLAFGAHRAGKQYGMQSALGESPTDHPTLRSAFSLGLGPGAVLSEIGKSHGREAVEDQMRRNRAMAT